MNAADRAALLTELADYRPGSEADQFDHVVEVLAEMVEDGLDHTTAVVLAAKLTGEPLWLFVPTEHEGRRLAHEHEIPLHLVRYIDPRSSRALLGVNPRLWIVAPDFWVGSGHFPWAANQLMQELQGRRIPNDLCR